MDSSNDPNDQLASLENPTTVVEPSAGASGVAPAPGDGPQTSKPPASPLHALGWLRNHLNLYLVLFILLIAASGGAGIWLYLHSSAPSTDTLSQSLSQSTLDQLSTSDINVGEPQHTLSIQSNAVFSGDVLVRNDLQIAGTLQVGSNLAIAGLRVTGNSTFDDIQISKSLSLTGNGSIQGQLNVQQALNVNGAGTFQGTVSAPSITAGALQLNGDLNLTHHISAGGATPSRSNGGALGGGGTATISGSDTAGTITLNTGGSPSAGCYITVTFAAKFNSTPHMALTPVGVGSAGLSYYVNRSTTAFSVCSTTAPTASSTIIFDYVVFD